MPALLWFYDTSEVFAIDLFYFLPEKNTYQGCTVLCRMMILMLYQKFLLSSNLQPSGSKKNALSGLYYIVYFSVRMEQCDIHKAKNRNLTGELHKLKIPFVADNTEQISSEDPSLFHMCNKHPSE
jgi:hypothetical protein